MKKATALLLFVFLAPACADVIIDELDPVDATPEALTPVPECPADPFRSVYIVDCSGEQGGAGKSGVCRGAQGEVLFSDCTLPFGAAPIHCVATCN